MAMKTNKSYKKRLKITKAGKILVRKPGQNHYNALENRKKKDAKKNRIELQMSPKKQSRFLVNIK